MLNINSERLLSRLKEMGKTGVDKKGQLTRLTGTDADKAGRDLLVKWMEEAGLQVMVDRTGDIFGLWETEENKLDQPIMIGSHLDTVINAGIYDGALGVIGALEAVQTMMENGVKTKRPVIVSAFTNAEGVRFHPGLLGSGVYTLNLEWEGGLELEDDSGIKLGDELKRIGYAGPHYPGFIVPKTFLELHIEEGPVLDSEGVSIGAVEAVQGSCTQEIMITGAADHSGNTPIDQQKNADHAAEKVKSYARSLAEKTGGVTTVGTNSFEADSVNVVPGKAVFTIEIRNTDADALEKEEKALLSYYEELEKTDGVTIHCEKLSNYKPVSFDDRICRTIEESAGSRGYSARRITSATELDAEMMSHISNAAAIFVPSVGGVSHSPEEFTKDENVIRGANVLLDVAEKYAM